MQKKVSVKMEEMIPGWLKGYPEHKFSVYKACFLSTKPNTHEFDISEEVLRRDACTILGNFLVAKIEEGDARSHETDEIIYGYFPKEQEVIFEITEEGYLKASAYVVISKMYGQEFNKIFMEDNFRNTSVEMTVDVDDYDEHKVVDFDIYGLTCLGRYINGSCSNANMFAVRFSAEEAKNYLVSAGKNNSILQTFVEERKKNMENNISYKINKSKEAVSNKAWGTVDKVSLRNKIMKAKNRATLVKSVYMKVENGWEDAPSEKLKYPVMCFDGDVLVYNRGGLASALGYAKKENEKEVVSKINKIYSSLGIKENVEMAELECDCFNYSSLKQGVLKAIEESDFVTPKKVLGVFEDVDKQNFVIVENFDNNLYKINLSLTKEGLTLGDSMNRVSIEMLEEQKKVDCEDKAKEAKCEDGQDVKKDKESKEGKKEEEKKETSDAKMTDTKEEKGKKSVEEMSEEIEKMEKDIADRDNIIMNQTKELEELRKFKTGVEKEKKTSMVEAVLAEAKEFLTEEQVAAFRDEGIGCDLKEIDAWSNKVKAFCFECGKEKNNKTKMQGKDFWSFSAPVETKKVKKSLWD